MFSNFYKLFLNLLEFCDWLWFCTEEWHEKNKQTKTPQDSILSTESTEFDAFFGFRDRLQVL